MNSRRKGLSNYPPSTRASANFATQEPARQLLKPENRRNPYSERSVINTRVTRAFLETQAASRLESSARRPISRRLLVRCSTLIHDPCTRTDRWEASIGVDRARSREQLNPLIPVAVYTVSPYPGIPGRGSRNARVLFPAARGAIHRGDAFRCLIRLT